MTDIQSLIHEYKMTGSKDLYVQILNTIRVLDKIWVPISQHTKSAFVEIRDNMPTAYIFTRREYCEEVRENLSNAMLLVRTVENPAKLRLQMFSDFLRSGVKKVIVDNGHVYQEILLSDIIKEVEVPEGKGRKPVKNPEIVLCANLFVQEMSRRNPAPELRNMLILAVTKGEFLVPANNDVKYDETGKIENGTQIHFQIIRNNQGQNFIPVYTDMLEFRKFDQQGKLASIVVPFAGIKPLLEQAEGIIINPQGVNIPLNMKVNDKKASQPATINQQVKDALKEDNDVNFDESYTVNNSVEVSEEMLSEVKEFLSAQSCVRKAYAIGIERNGKPGCLYVVDYDGDSIAMYQGLVMTSARYVGALQVEVKNYELSEAKRLISGRVPFYEA